MSNAWKIALAAVIAIVVVVGGVGAFLAVNNAPAKGTVTVLVKDLPGDWTHVNITFSEVRIHKANASNNSGWISLPLKNRTVDLASLTNVSGLLASGNVSVGKYTQIRFVVTSVIGTMSNGTMVTFKVPSGELRTNHPFTVSANHTETLTLDFDLDHSIVHNSQGWTFKPVLGPIIES